MPNTSGTSRSLALRSRAKGLAVALVVLLALAAVQVVAGDGPRITQFAFSGGGGVSAAGEVRLSGEVGQAIAGGVASGEASLAGGLRHDVFRSTYLPLLLR
jgi:hypothetical protein